MHKLKRSSEIRVEGEVKSNIIDIYVYVYIVYAYIMYGS